MLLTRVILRTSHYTCILVKSSPEPYKVGTIIVSFILQVRKL